MTQNKTTDAQNRINTRHNYEALAKRARLRYVSDEEPGFTRKRWGKALLTKMLWVTR